MEQSSDFSFHKGNQFPSVEEEESPKPMPRPPVLPVKDSPDQDSDVADAIEVNKDDQQESLQSVEVLETLTIAPIANTFKTPTNRHGVTTVSLPPPKLLSTQVSSSALNSRRRAKIPLERGFTQVDWMRLTKTNPDLAGLNGTSNQRLIPMEEIRQHESEENAWTIFQGKVYNITSYLKFHPGGKDKLMEGAGKDCTALFNKYHAWVNAEFLLEKCLVGYLDVPDSNTK